MNKFEIKLVQKQVQKSLGSCKNVVKRIVQIRQSKKPFVDPSTILADWLYFNPYTFVWNIAQGS